MNQKTDGHGVQVNHARSGVAPANRPPCRCGRQWWATAASCVIRSSCGGGVDRLLEVLFCLHGSKSSSGGGDGCSRVAVRRKWSRQASTTRTGGADEGRNRNLHTFDTVNPSLYRIDCGLLSG